MKLRIVIYTLLFIFFTPDLLFSDDWYRSVPDSTTPSLGWDCSITLDSNGYPHIVYHDNSFGDLRYAKFDGNTWNTEIIDSIGTVGRHCSIVLDQNDIPHISYQKVLARTNVGLKYATMSDTGWTTIFLDTEEAGAPDMWTSIGINPAGYPCISYQNVYSDKIMFANLDAEEWHFQEIADINGTYFTKLQFLSDGKSVICYADENEDQTAAIFKFAVIKPDYESWVIQQHSASLFFLPPYKWTDFVIDKQDNYHLLYLSTDFHMYYDFMDGAIWQSEDLYDFYPSTARMTLDNNDVPHIVMEKDGDLFYLSLVEGEWTEEIIDDQVNAEFSSSLAFDGMNRPHIAVQGTVPGSNKEESLIYYTYISGNPQIAIAESSYDFGDVSTGSYLDWDCIINNIGDAPLTIDELTFNSNYFSFISANLPITVQPEESGIVTIRFAPTSTIYYQDELSIHSNDPDSPVVTVSLEGTGVAAGDFGDLTAEIKNVFLEMNYGTINESTALEEADISIYDGNELIAGAVQTNASGEATLNNIPVGGYKLKISNVITLPDEVTEKTLNKYLDISIGPGANSFNTTFPESLIVQKYNIIHELTHLETNKFSVPYNFSYAESEAEVEQTLGIWNAYLDKNMEASLARLLLSESMVNELFEDGLNIGVEATHDVGDLISFIFYSDDWLHKLLTIIIDLLKSMQPGGSRDLMQDIFQMLMEEALKQFVLEMVTEGVELAAAEVPQPGEQLIIATWKDIKREYCGFPDLSLNSSNWAHVKSLVYDMLKIPFFQEVYIDQLTGPSIEKANNYASSNQLNGETSDAYENKINFVSTRKNEIEITKEVAYGLRVSANLLMMATQMLDWVETLDPTGIAGEIASQASFYMKAAAYVNVATAFGMSVYQFFITPQKIDRSVDKIFFPDGKPANLSSDIYTDLSTSKLISHSAKKPLAKMSKSTQQLLVNNLKTSLAEYNSVLDEIKNGFENADYLNSVAKLEQLVDAERELKQSIKATQTPIQAVAAQADTTIDNFPVMYDSLMSYHGKAAQERFINYFTVFCMGLDSSNDIRSSVFNQLEKTSASQNQLSEHLIITLDTVVNRLEVPAIVIGGYSEQEDYSLSENQTTTIKVRLRNTGSLSAEDIRVKLTTSAGLTIESDDSLNIGDLNSGEQTKTLSWTITAIETDNPKAVWDIKIYSSNAKTYPISGSVEFVTKTETPATGAKLKDENIYCYPNPFNPEHENVNLRYSLAKEGKVTINIYDVGGNPVKTILNKESQSAAVEYSISWDGRNEAGNMVTNGVYFFIIESSSGERAVGKIAILR